MKRPGPDAARLAAYAMGAVAIAIAATNLWIYITSLLAVPAYRGSPEQHRWIVHVAMKSGAALIAALLAILIGTRSANQRGNGLLALAMAGAALAQALENEGAAPLLVYGAFSDWYPSRPVFDRGVWILYALGTSLALAAALRWTQLFPRPLTRAELGAPSPRWRWLRRVQALLLEPAALWGVFGVLPFTLLLLHGTRLDVVAPGGRLLFVAATAVIAAANLAVGYAGAAAQNRRRVYWVLAAALAAAAFYAAALAAVAVRQGLGLDAWIVAWSALLLYPMGTITLVALLAFAVLYHGAVDPSLVVRRTALYGALGLAITVTFVALEGALTSLVVVRFALPDYLGSLIAGSTLAVFFGPIRHRVEGFTTRLVRRLMPHDALAAQPRATAAIVCADIAGFSRLARADETTALTLVSLFHAAARAAAARHGGALAAAAGDAVTLRLPDADAAVHAALRLQQQFRATAATLGIEAPPVRCGADAGEIVTTPDGDVLGAAVTLAGRLEAVAGPGSVLASAAVLDALRGGPWAVTERARRALRGVSEPVDSAYVAAARDAGPQHGARGAA